MKKQEHFPAGEKVNAVVYAHPNEYASFPQIVRTDEELVLLFQVQDLEKLRAIPEHQHYQMVAQARWAVSRNGGRTWAVRETCPPLGPVRDITYSSAPLKDGGTVTLTFHTEEPLQAVIQRGRVSYRPYLKLELAPGESAHTIRELGPFARFWPHGMKRLSDGTILAAGYAPFRSPSGRDKTTAVFPASSDEGRTWSDRSHVENANAFDFSEPDLLETRGGRIIALLRAD